MSRRTAGQDTELHRHVRAVSEAACAFERRWTLAALKRAASELAGKLVEQRSRFDQACVAGTLDDIEAHAAAMCRGYAAAVRALEAAQEPDDAYLLGQDPRTGFRVAVGHQKAAAERVAEIAGEAVVWLSVDEVATIIGGLEAFKPLASIKRLFPGAEILDLRPNEPAKRDSGVEDAA